MRTRRLQVLIPAAQTTLVGPNGRRDIIGSAIAIDDARLAAGRVDELVAGTGGRRAAAAIVVPAGVASRWAAVVSHMRCPAVVVSRPLAAVSGWELPPGSTRLIIDRRDDGVEIAAVTEDGVIAAEYCDRSHPPHVAAAARAVLGGVDPDQEWAIRECGVDVLTEGSQPEWVGALANLLGIPAQETDDPVGLFSRGVRNDRAVIDRCLAAERIARRRTRAATIESRRSVAWE